MRKYEKKKNKVEKDKKTYVHEKNKKKEKRKRKEKKEKNKEKRKLTYMYCGTVLQFPPEFSSHTLRVRCECVGPTCRRSLLEREGDAAEAR